MATYSYRALSAQGKKVKGLVRASTEAGARRLLQQQQFTVLSIGEKKEQSPFRNFGKRVSIKEKIIFTNQLGVMIKSGLSVTEALKSLGGETQNKYFREAINDIRSQVESGSALSDCMAKYPKIFPEVYVEVIRSGEVTGSLDTVLKRLSIQLEKDYELIAKVKSAMIYPIIVFCLLIGVVVIIVTYIIPRLKDVFVSVDSELPVSTRILLAVSDFSVRYFWLCAIFFVVFVFVFRFVTCQGAGQLIWHRIKLRIPIFGVFSRKIILARFTRTFGALSAAGVPVLSIFNTTARVVGNVVFKKDIENIAADVRNGVPMSFAFRKSKNFPTMVAQLTAIGERAGDMQEVFQLLADFYEKEVDNIAKNLSSMLEPIIMIVMGLGVGFILMAVLQPIYGLVSAV